MLAKREKSTTMPCMDICRHLLGENSKDGCIFKRTDLSANGALIIVAGSDTTSSTMTQIFWKICMNQNILRKLQAEIDDAWNQDSKLGVEETRGLVYLNAVVNEGLRLLNPIPSGIQATVPPGGLEINGVFIPAHIQVTVPHLVLMTDERYFPRGDEFWPERWLNEEMGGIRNRKAFIPWGYGLHTCVGKQLALNESKSTFFIPYH
jgi:cytochrome P450